MKPEILSDAEIKQATGLGHNTIYEQLDNQIGYSLNSVRAIAQVQLDDTYKKTLEMVIKDLKEIYSRQAHKWWIDRFIQSLQSQLEEVR